LLRRDQQYLIVVIPTPDEAEGGGIRFLACAWKAAPPKGVGTLFVERLPVKLLHGLSHNL
jgi:hypothetical protein